MVQVHVTPDPSKASRRERAFEPALLLAIVLVVLAVTAFITMKPWRRNQVAWSSNLSDALSNARLTGRPVYVELYANWCPPCRRMEREAFSDPEVARTLANLEPTHLNYDQADVQRLSRKWHTEALPVHVLLNPDGSVRARAIGYLDASQLLAWLTRYAKQRD